MRHLPWVCKARGLGVFWLGVGGGTPTQGGFRLTRVLSWWGLRVTVHTHTTFQCLLGWVTREWKPERGRGQALLDSRSTCTHINTMIQVKQQKMKHSKNRKDRERNKPLCLVCKYYFLSLIYEQHSCSRAFLQDITRAHLEVKCLLNEPTARGFNTWQWASPEAGTRRTPHISMQAQPREDVLLVGGREEEEKKSTQSSVRRLREAGYTEAESSEQVALYPPVLGLIRNRPCSFPDRMRYVISAFVPISLLVAKTASTWVPGEVSSGTLTR